jgi:hypothetical protein
LPAGGEHLLVLGAGDFDFRVSGETGTVGPKPERAFGLAPAPNGPDAGETIGAAEAVNAEGEDI